MSGMISRDTTVWLAYVSYPITTAVYLERALRKICNVVTVGPSLPEEYLEKWALQDMKLPILPHDIVTEFAPDMAEVVRQRGSHPLPDLFVWVTSVQGFEPFNLEALGCPTACYLVDSHLFLSGHLQWVSRFDYAFIAQREYLGEFRKVHTHVHWLPLGCDPEIHRKTGTDKCHEIGFVGGVEQGTRREALLVELSSHVPVHYQRCFWDDMSAVFSASKIVFNNAVKNDLNMRFFEVMSTGTLLLSDKTTHTGQDELFVDGEEYVRYEEDNLVERAQFYLKHEILREKIAERGQRLVHNAHTYLHRVIDLLAVTLQGKADTWSAPEMRQRSVVGVPDLLDEVRDAIEARRPGRSFVIPVLDYSPASQYSIVTLLADLEQVEGEVVVIFNSEELARELSRHPRITRYAIMKENVGVSRAWNIGISMSAADVVFILNADLHVSAEAVDCLHEAMTELPAACCVGPQGSFVHYALCKDYHHFGKGSFDRPIEVDAVSGFFFAIQRRLFNQYGIRFEESYTPCYFEEWDIGLQIRRAGLKSYVVPTRAYDHHWGGTIQALRTISFMGQEETAGEILLRNRQLFLAKWRTLIDRCHMAGLFQSGWQVFLKTTIQAALDAEKYAHAGLLIDFLRRDFPDDAQGIFWVKYLELCQKKVAQYQ